MWIDSDKNANQGVSSYADEGFFNHTFLQSKSHNEAHRRDEADDRWESEFPLDRLASCEKIDETISKIDNKITEVVNWDAKERVINRNRASLESRRVKFSNLFTDKKCSQQYIEEQDAEYLKKVEEIFRSQDARAFARKQEDNTLMYVAMGVGFMVIASVIILANR